MLYAELASAGQPTQYEVTYAEAFSEWCLSHGEHGNPSGGTASLQLPASGNLEFLEIPLQGLADGREYCAVVRAQLHGGRHHDRLRRLPDGLHPDRRDRRQRRRQGAHELREDLAPGDAPPRICPVNR